jgi:L-seryl-tRNA(Ser) seleniumtransferase
MSETEFKSIYEELGMHRIINANFPSTLLGGSRLPPEVMDAVNDANEHFGWMWELEERAGEIIAEITGGEMAHVTTGTFGGLVLSAAACMTGTDRQAMAKLPHPTEDIDNEFIIQRCLRRLKYDRAVEVPGGEYVPVGDRDGCTAADIEAAISDSTAGIHYLAPGPGSWPGPDYVKGTRPGYECATNAVPIEEVIDIANDHDVPIIVDAAGQSYPLEGFTRYIDMGADLVCYSGKYFEGPNAAGFITGREDLVTAAFHNNFLGCDGYSRKEPSVVEYLPDDEYTKDNKPVMPQGPNETYGVGRGYKLDRSDIVALVVALQRWVDMDHDTERIEPAIDKGKYIRRELRDVDGVELELGDEEYHVLLLTITCPGRSPEFAETLEQELLYEEPIIWPRKVGVSDANDPEVVLNLLWLRDGEEQLIADRLNTILSE